MTIDEAIEQFKERAEDSKKISELGLKSYVPQAKEEEQIAEWLELLKWYQQGMEDIPSESGVLPKDVYHAGYNKAIDDFAILMKETFNHDWATTKISEQIIYNRLFDKCNEIAEQLKAGN